MKVLFLRRNIALVQYRECIHSFGAVLTVHLAAYLFRYGISLNVSAL